MELWDLYNGKRELPGREHIRELFHSGKLVDTLEYFFEKVDKQCC